MVHWLEQESLSPIPPTEVVHTAPCGAKNITKIKLPVKRTKKLEGPSLLLYW